MKRIIQGIVCATMIFMVTACNGSGATTSGAVETSPSAATTAQVPADQGATPPGSSSSADPNQKVVYGEISEVAGNTFVLKEIKMPEGFNGQFGQRNGEQGGRMGTPPTERPSRDPNAAPQRTQRVVEYTGEEIEVMIPVGMSISTMTFSQEGMKESEVDMNAMKSGSRIMVTYGADGATIQKVLLMPTGGGARFSGGGAPGAAGSGAPQAPTIIQQ